MSMHQNSRFKTGRSPHEKKLRKFPTFGGSHTQIHHGGDRSESTQHVFVRISTRPIGLAHAARAAALRVSSWPDEYNEIFKLIRFILITYYTDSYKSTRSQWLLYNTHWLKSQWQYDDKLIILKRFCAYFLKRMKYCECFLSIDDGDTCWRAWAV